MCWLWCSSSQIDTPIGFNVPAFYSFRFFSDLNRFTKIFLEILEMVDLIPIDENFYNYLIKVKKREQEKLK